MKILVVCGNGLGSSFMMELTIKKALLELSKEAEVTHTDLTSATSEKADIYIGAGDIVDQLDNGVRKVVRIVNMMSIPEIKGKLAPLL
ncbi:PTS sugar transporter subunit IIB [Lysinibacillus sphaericus]|uniref:PTS sugar transporter subunit IIB n=1 Tax=Lysinibacillus tabacifolii TaxID=1173107 RepID=A0ABY2SXJ5_9BACI|nr:MULTISPECIES: PTS sugar transporter subunit IIB [Lysinibacillus]MCS1381870.1 PTS sugar transporter subunit IIB [Lysinibacillus sphaericus]TKI48023.1 PTS sugar transporter subunit IIB [Lysinibacillus tabacifolii]UDK96174.1 PTS sugar transporter subunit IIB [Lysinibacillus sphaericus]